MAHPLVGLKRLREMPSLSPREVDHNSQTVQSCVSLEQREVCIISLRKSSFLGSSEFPSWRLTPADRCVVFQPQSNVAFNSKNCIANIQYYSDSCHLGKGWWKEWCGLEPRTNVFAFKKSPETECGLYSRIYGI
jgi:hypothetical protein